MVLTVFLIVWFLASLSIMSWLRARYWRGEWEKMSADYARALDQVACLNEALSESLANVATPRDPPVLQVIK